MIYVPSRLVTLITDGIDIATALKIKPNVFVFESKNVLVHFVLSFITMHIGSQVSLRNG